MERKILKMSERGYDGGVVLSLECGHTRNVTHEEMLMDMTVIYRAQLSKPSDTHHNVIVCPQCAAQPLTVNVTPSQRRALLSALKASSRYVDNDHKLVILDQSGAAVLRFDCQEK